MLGSDISDFISIKVFTSLDRSRKSEKRFILIKWISLVELNFCKSRKLDWLRELASRKLSVACQ